MSTYAVTTGSAFRVAHNDGDPRVRWYTAADGSSWIGHDTHDVAYCCSRSCQTTVLTEAGFGWDFGHGKSTVAQLLAERFPRAVHVRGDAFRRAIVTGREEMSADPSDEAVSQLLLRYELMASTADAYAARGFTVVAQDVILGPVLETVIAMFATRPLGLVVLAPSSAVVRERERARAKDGYHTFTPEQLDASLRAETPRRGLWVDSSRQTPEQTADEILERIDPDGLIRV